MKTTIETAAFVKELEWISRFIEPKSTIPILSNVLIEHTVGGILKLTATDLEVASISTNLVVNECHEGEPWSIAAPARLMLKYCKKIEESHISIEPIAGELPKLAIEHGDSKVSFDSRLKEDFPVVPTLEPTAEISGLRKAIPRTLVAVSKEESRFTLNGALLDSKNSALISTDGHRLSYHPIKIDGEIGKTLIPKAALAEAGRLLNGSRDSLYFGRDDNHVVMRAGDRTIISRVLTGNFPDWERVIPKEFDHCVMLEVSSLSKSLGRLETVAPENGLISFHINGAMELSTGNVGTAKASAKIPTYCDEPELDWGVGSGFNVKYLQDFCNGSGDRQISFHFNEPQRTDKEGKELKSPFWQAAEWRTADGWRYVLMPMRA